MLKKHWICILALLLTPLIHGQSTDSTKNYSSTSPDTDSSPATTDTSFVFKPVIGLGSGMFSFYGDLYKKHFQNPFTSRIGYEFSISQKLTESFQFNFYVLFGKLGANERQNLRNVNFESQIRMGGITLQYNFGELLPLKRSISPYLLGGIESLEFLSKTDLFDKLGNRYYYWSDGSIRNIDEKSPNASSAHYLIRDYSYESDIRELNVDKFGKYPERSFAIPVGLGILMHLTPRTDLKIGTTFHYTFTDYIDGITYESLGNRKGNGQNDNFVMTSFSLNYNLFKPRKKDTVTDDTYKDVDFLALDTEDKDNDGINDFEDSCQNTPKGVAVDGAGCPVDDDNDFVPNYKDKQKNTPVNVFVDAQGVQLTDSAIARQYLSYIDSTGEYGKVEIRIHQSDGNSITYTPVKQYSIQLGSFKSGVPKDQMGKFLSFNDVSTHTGSDSAIVYSVGNYSNYLSAYKRQIQLKKEGFKNTRIIYKKEGQIFEAEELFVHGISKPAVAKQSLSARDTSKSGYPLTKTVTDSADTYSPLSEDSLIALVNELDSLDFSDSTLFMEDSGAIAVNTQKIDSIRKTPIKADSLLITKTDIAQKQTDSIPDRKDTTVVAKETPRDTAVVLNKSPQEIVKTDSVPAKTDSSVLAKETVDPKNTSSQKNIIAVEPKSVPKPNVIPLPITENVAFRVQLGAYKNELSRNIFIDVHDLIIIKTDDGLYRYMTAAYSSFNEAAKRKVDLYIEGFESAFITAYKNGKRVPLNEVGATPTTKEKEVIEESSKPISTVNKNLVTFKVQVGIFKYDPPADMQAKFDKISNLKKEKTISGLTRYVVGSFSEYNNAAINFKNEISTKYDLPDAFIIGNFNGQYISVQEALELLK